MPFSRPATDHREPRFRLHVLDLQWPDFPTPRYTVDAVWPFLLTIDLARSLLVLTERDFALYDWSRQEILLSKVTIANLAPEPKQRLLRNALGQAFVTTFDGEPLYGGVFYEAAMPPAIRFPVINPFGSPTSLLRIRPGMHGAWSKGALDQDPAFRSIADPRLHAWLTSQGLIAELPATEQHPEIDF